MLWQNLTIIKFCMLSIPHVAVIEMVSAACTDQLAHTNPQFEWLGTAAAVMYQKAARLAGSSGEMATQVAVTAQCQSYLAAMDSLSLMAEDKQFIVVDSDGKKEEQPVNLTALRQ